jgi:hypothetical protein
MSGDMVIVRAITLHMSHDLLDLRLLASLGNRNGLLDALDLMVIRLNTIVCVQEILVIQSRFFAPMSQNTPQNTKMNTLSQNCGKRLR